MKRFFTKTVFFPIGRLEEAFLHLYLDRYTVETLGGVWLDGVAVEQSTSSSEDTSLLSVIMPDDKPLTRFRKGSIYSGTIPQVPVYDLPPLEDGSPDPSATLLGHTLKCGWPEAFLNDLADPPVDLQDAFEGVSIIS